MFQQGVQLERQGKIYDAVAYYRKATQLVPDIEFKMYNLELAKVAKKQAEPEATVNNNQALDFDKDEDLYEKFTQLALESDDYRLAEPETETTATHISCLPYEVFVYMLKWLVSNDLDMRSLEQVSLVCRGFYIAARDKDIWRLACARAWGVINVDTQYLLRYDNSWRKMFIERPRLNFNGCYISRTTYVRHGESSFQDFSYRPCHIVEYYRYLRFFPGGKRRRV